MGKRFEVPVGDDGNPMPALLEPRTDPDERMHVAVRAERDEDDVGGSHAVAENKDRK